jgi:hypothetical protein
MQVNFANVTQTPTQLKASGYYPDNHANGVNVYVRDFTDAGSWTLAFNFPANGTADEIKTFTGITANMVDSETMHVLFHHPDNGTAAHRLYLDLLEMQITADIEHFKECGHALEEKAAGIDQLVWASIHLL